VHEAIKTRSGNFQEYIENYKKSIENLAHCGISIVCYNFMPVLDWTRTSLNFELADGSKALLFNLTAFIAFELYILKRPGAEDSYNNKEKDKAKMYYDNLSINQIEELTNTIIAIL